MSHHHKRHGGPDNSNIRAFWINMAVRAAIGLFWLVMFKWAGHKHVQPAIEIALPLPIPEIRDILPPDERTVIIEQADIHADIGLPEPELIKPKWTSVRI